MRKEGSILFVRASTLVKHPQAFQEYVKRFFANQMIGNEDYFYAFQTISGISHIYDSEQKGKGVAPSHSVDLSMFTDEKKTNLFEYIHRLLTDKNQGDVFKISRSWDDGCVGTEDCD